MIDLLLRDVQGLYPRASGARLGAQLATSIALQRLSHLIRAATTRQLLFASGLEHLQEQGAQRDGHRQNPSPSQGSDLDLGHGG